MIIGDGIVLGTGGETASIIVTAPTGSTVTCTTPGGIVLTATEVSGTWTFTKLKVYGTYTVTAINGINTATQDVLVDSATQYDIELEYKLWLYRNGDECEDITGGWVRTTTGDFYGYPFTGTVTFNADNIYIATLDTRQIPFANTVNTIDLTGYSTLKIEYENATVGHYEPDRMSRICIASAVGVASMQGYFEKNLSFSGSGISELDVTSLSGGKYIVLTTAADLKIHSTITKVWLE